MNDPTSLRRKQLLVAVAVGTVAIVAPIRERTLDARSQGAPGERARAMTHQRMPSAAPGQLQPETGTPLQTARNGNGCFALTPSPVGDKDAKTAGRPGTRRADTAPPALPATRAQWAYMPHLRAAHRPRSLRV